VLFDLRSPRRRRFIQVTYATLAFLMAGGLVFFGIGSDATGGLADIFGGGGGSAETGFEDQIEDAEQRVEENPRNQKALLELVELQFQAANQQFEADPETGQPVFTDDAGESFERAADAWDQYLGLKPKEPDTGTAQIMADTFFVLAQNSETATDAQTEVANAASAQRIVVNETSSASNLQSLAFYLYYAGDFAEADRTAQQALAEASAKQRKAIEKQLAQTEGAARKLEKQANAEAKGAKKGENPLQEPAGGLGGGGGLGAGGLPAP
jgi:hypothetical protein